MWTRFLDPSLFGGVIYFKNKFVNKFEITNNTPTFVF